jgi:hypothetical protein
MFTGRPYIINAQALTDVLLLSWARPRWKARSRATRALRCACWPASRAACTAWCMTCRPMRCTAACSASSATCCATCPASQKQCNGCSVNPAGGSAAGAGSVVPARELRVSLPVSKATIASRLSLTPEYFSRVLHELEGVGLIQIDKRDIRIPDPGRLARYQLQ